MKGDASTKALRISIPFPSGIQVDSVTDASGRIFRFGRLQHNAISIRPQWRSINIIENVFSKDECQSIVLESENYAAIHGWSKGRHVDYDIRPTQDLPLNVIYEDQDVLDKLYERFAAKIWPSMAKEFRLDPNHIRPADLFITKYNASRKENFLGPHQDKSPFSFVIPLNDGFKGGGTYFFDTETLWVPPVGSALYFSGSQWHGGSPVMEGVRYILAGFCEYGSIDLRNVAISSEVAHSQFMSMYDPLYDGTAALAGFRSGDLIVGLEVCDEINVNDNTFNTDATSTKGNIIGIRRRKADITGFTSDDEWVRFAQSCEQLEPGSDTVIWVRRKEGNTV